jgi:hypothetical protein
MADSFRFQYKVPSELAAALESSRHRYAQTNGGQTVRPERYIEAVLKQGFIEMSGLVAANKHLEQDLRSAYHASMDGSKPFLLDYNLTPEPLALARDLMHSFPRERKRRGRVYWEALVRGLMYCNVVSIKDNRVIVQDTARWKFDKLTVAT